MASGQTSFARAQWGYKPGARRLLRRCLGKTDLPGRGWRRVGQRTYRTGYATEDEAWADNARTVRSVSAWRSYVKRRTRQYIQVQLVPLASTHDVAGALEAARDGRLRNFRNRATTLSSDDVELGQDAVPGATNLSATEREISSAGESSMVRTLYFNVGRFVVIIVATDVYGHWTWDAVLACALAQVARLHPVENEAWSASS
jgi:hypothetical protein